MMPSVDPLRNSGPYQEYCFAAVKRDLLETARSARAIGLTTRPENDLVNEAWQILTELKEFRNNPRTTWKLGTQEYGSETLILYLGTYNGVDLRLKPASVAKSSQRDHKLHDLVKNYLPQQMQRTSFYRRVKDWFVHFISESPNKKVITIEIASQFEANRKPAIPPKLLHTGPYLEFPATGKTVSRSLLAMILTDRLDWAWDKLHTLGSDVRQSVSIQNGVVKVDMEAACRQVKHDLTEHRELRALVYALFSDTTPPESGRFDVQRVAMRPYEAGFKLSHDGNIRNRVNIPVVIAVCLSVCIACGTVVLQAFVDKVQIGSFIEVLTGSLVVSVGYAAVIAAPDWDLLHALRAVEPLKRYYKRQSSVRKAEIAAVVMRQGLFGEKFSKQRTSFLGDRAKGLIDLAHPLKMQDLVLGGALVGRCNGNVGVVLDGVLTTGEEVRAGRVMHFKADKGVLTLTDYGPSVQVE